MTDTLNIGDGGGAVSQNKFVGGDISPVLTEDQVKLIRLQESDAYTRRRTRRGTEGVYEGIDGKAAVPVNNLDEALLPRTLDQAIAAARFLARNGKAFYVVCDPRKEGGYISVPESKAKPYLDAGTMISLHGTPTPQKLEKPARAGRKAAAPPAPDPAAITPGGCFKPITGDPEAIIAVPDYAPLSYVPPGPLSASEISSFTGDLMHNASKPELAGYCREQLEGGGWGEECIQLVGAAVAQEIIRDTDNFADVVYTAKAVLYVDRASPPSDLAAFAEAIMYQAQGGMSAYLEALKAETAELTELNKSVGAEAPAGLILANIAAGRRIIAVQAGIGQELPPPETKPKRQRKKKADPPAPPADPAPQIIRNECTRCTNEASWKEVFTEQHGWEKVCEACRVNMEKDGLIVDNPAPEVAAMPEVLEAIEESPVADPLAYLSDMSEPDPFE